MFELKMPKLGESVTEGTIGKWLKSPGDKVNKYDLLVEVQTDKVNTEIPSPVAGSPAAGDAGGAAASAPPPSAPAASSPAPASAPSAPRPAQPAYATVSPSDGNGAARADLSDVRATPAVRKLASENDVDISQLEGTGLGGRVSKKDVEDFIAQRASTPQPQARAQTATQQPTAAHQQAAARVIPAQPQAQPARPAPVPSLSGDTLVPLTQMRRAIANNMVQAWSAPHAHAVMPVDVTDLMKYRDTVKGEFMAREGFDLSPAAFIAKAVVEALRAVPTANASWTDQGLIL